MGSESEIRAALKTWRDGLVGLTRQSALIKFRAAKTSSLLIDSPTPDDVFAALLAGKPKMFRGDVDFGDDEAIPESLAVGTYFHSPRPETEVGPVVRNLMRKAQAEFLDRGLSVLYVAFGLLDWQDEDGTQMSSPLLLLPVTLIPEGPKGTPRVTEGEDDAVLNPALTLRLHEFGIELPTADQIEGLTPSQVCDAVRAVLDRHTTFKNWILRDDRTYLSTFSFAKEAMFRDLLDNEAAILEHPIIRALATSDPSAQTGEFQFDPIDPADIDRLAPPEVNPLVLDADSSQRAAVAAALDGRTFVMDGPPGTGKSQTIANMIGALLHAGKTILFVSEKIAALDVVRNRLDHAGLGSYLLELHSHKSSRKEVAQELLRTLDNVAIPPVGMPDLSRRAVKERREQLSAYAIAMNETRQPLNLSLHTVLGMYANLATAPVAPVPDKVITDLSEPEYADIQETLRRLVRAWRPAAQGESFLWRDVIDDQSLEVRLYQAESALQQLRDTVALNRDLTDAFGLTKPSHVPQLVALLQHQHHTGSIGALESWLTADSDRSLVEARDALGRRIEALQTAEALVIDAAGVPWSILPSPDEIPPSPEAVAVTSPVDLRTVSTRDLSDTATRFEAQARMLEERTAAIASLASSLNLPFAFTFNEIDRITRFVDLRSQNSRPDRRWFSPSVLADARRAVTALREQGSALADAESKASGVFTAEALKAPLAELQDRFTNLHTGLKKMSSAYKTDKRTIAGLLQNANDVKRGINHLSDAISWHETSKAYDLLSSTHGGLLGSHWAGRDTNFEALRVAFDVVQEVLMLTDNDPPAALVGYLTSTDSNAAHQSVADLARFEIEGWKQTLAPPPALTSRPELLLGNVDDAVAWLTAHVAPMRAAATRIGAVADVTGRDHTLEEADNLLAMASSARSAAAAIDAEEVESRTIFGGHYAGANTDLEALDEAMRWAGALRDLSGGPLTPGQVKALAASNPQDNLSLTHDKWVSARDSVVAAFAGTRADELVDEFDSYRGGQSFIEDLRDDTLGQSEWFAFRAAYESLSRRGLNVAVDYCVENRIGAQDVPGTVNRALLRGWADGVIGADERLHPPTATDRETLVAEYRTLDRELIKAATSDIIKAANTRRPTNTNLGEPAVIRREGMKQRKHRPVRELMAATRTATPAIKPVFMMSPLAVSQYLPPDMTFDVVIFDEASQVTPADAVNCIYRGKAMILAGDDKQLPPTSFFERTADDDDDDTDVKDFQSVLELAKAAGAFNNLGLRWHYRSRHEDLIAFSNYKFYEGKLVTFPSAHMEGDNVGVEFFHAHGTYRRGGGAINPEEARKVAERVIEHFSTRPDLTLGVVTFSVAQADAVQAAIDEARIERRDLDRFFDTDDRLDGFFIRALEQVQGDERDVIVFSVGYGPDEARKISTNFGALNRDKGWRRLNVGITRARQRVEVVASMTAREIPPTTNENVEFFRAYLDYAERGQQTLAVPYSSTGLDPDSPFEESVIAAIRSWGYTVEPQVGAAGFRIDIGVRHPAYPGMYAIGVECDGYQYHSAPAARDRDRLRDQVLTGLGWQLHRIWGTAWYRNRSAEEERLKVAIQTAIDTPIRERTRRSPAPERAVVETEHAGYQQAATWTTPYRTAGRMLLPGWVSVSEPANHLHLVQPLEHLVEVEGPVHIETVYERIRDWWDIGRVGSKIANNLDLAIQRANIHRDSDDFLSIPATQVAHVRTPTDYVDRKVEHIHLDEIGMAVVLTLRDVGAAGRAELVNGIARTFGWARTGALVDKRVNDAIDRQLARGAITGNDDALTVAPGDATTTR